MMLPQFTANRKKWLSIVGRIGGHGRTIRCNVRLRHIIAHLIAKHPNSRQCCVSPVGVEIGDRNYKMSIYDAVTFVDQVVMLQDQAAFKII